MKDKNIPTIKRQKVSSSEVNKFKLKDSKGKAHDVKEERFVEQEIDNTHLVKIAPMFYFCTDNNKILMIPFSIQFSVEEFLKQTAGMATGLDKFLNKEKGSTK